MALIAAPAHLLPARRPAEARGRAVARPRSSFRRLTQAARWLSNLFIVLSLVAFAGLAAGPHLFGYRTESMITGSMAPYIEPGDVVVIAPLAPSRLAVGDVISYQVPVGDREIVTHRVVAVNRTADGLVTFRTKGDANASADPWTAQVTGNQVWTARGVVPVLGHMIRWLRDPYVSRLLRIVVPTLLVLSSLQAIWGGSSPGGRTDPVAEAIRQRRSVRPPSSLPPGARNPFAVSVYPRQGSRR